MSRVSGFGYQPVAPDNQHRTHNHIEPSPNTLPRYFAKHLASTLHIQHSTRLWQHHLHREVPARRAECPPCDQTSGDQPPIEHKPRRLL